MKPAHSLFSRYHSSSIIAAVLFFLVTAAAGSAVAAEYKSLAGVNRIRAVFDVSIGSVDRANTVFWAVRNAYDDRAARALPEKPNVVVVFRGPAVQLLTASHNGLSTEEAESRDEFAEMIRKMKAEGVTFEVCMYAVKVSAIDPGAILPEIDRVGNGFISVIGYQQQGYSVVRIN